MDSMIEECLALIDDFLIRGFCRTILQEIEYEFAKTAGSTGRHHCFEGGLLLHSCSVAKLCGAMADHYIRMGKKLNKSVAVAGGLLQDIGKIHCYVKGGRVIQESGETIQTWHATYDDEHFHHIPIGFHMASSVAERLGIQDHEDIKHVLHLIVSHHGKKEWSSPRTPKTFEALICHHADYVDAAIFATPEAFKLKTSGATY